jgi:hypothetical protein
MGASNILLMHLAKKFLDVALTHLASSHSSEGKNLLKSWHGITLHDQFYFWRDGPECGWENARQGTAAVQFNPLNTNATAHVYSNIFLVMSLVIIAVLVLYRYQFGTGASGLRKNKKGMEI